jgi:hypothetical protein
MYETLKIYFPHSTDLFIITDLLLLRVLILKHRYLSLIILILIILFIMAFIYFVMKVSRRVFI